jgi:transcriptional regulator with XRE-family HTH domain
MPEILRIQGVMMAVDEPKVTTFTSITILLLREVRLEQGLHQAQIADMLSATPSAWTKIEAGKSALSLENLFRVCNGLRIPPSTLMAAMERYATLMAENGWAVISTQLGFDDDALLKEAQEYYSSAGFRGRAPLRWGVLNGPTRNFDGSITPAEVFAFALDANFKMQQIDYKPPTWP